MSDYIPRRPAIMLASVLERSDEYFHLQTTTLHPVDILSLDGAGILPSNSFSFGRCDLLRFFRLPIF